MDTSKLSSGLAGVRVRRAMFAAALVTSLLGLAAPASAQTPISTDLFAVTGTATLPGGATVPVWGYNGVDNSPVTQPGGPTVIVNQGDVVTITLHNGLSEATSLLVQGQSMIPDTTGAASGATKAYTFTASNPGTYLYEAGLLRNAQHQVAMGLYGALIVRPAGAAGQAYADASTAFDDEAVLVLSEIDPALNSSADPAAFDMRDFAPKYFLINGKAYPDTAAIASAPGNKVLLRYVNAGAKHHSMAVLGQRQNFVAKDAGVLPQLTHNVAAETLASGQTGDAIVSMPASLTADARFAVYDGNLMLHNNGATGFGGMLTFVTASGTPTGDTTGPATSSVSLTATSVSATVSDAASGGANVSAAEFFIDTTGANGSGAAMTGAFGSVTVSVSATISPALTGTHTVYVHGQDSAGNWGPFQSAVISIDTTGPTVSALGLAPNPTNGTANVTLSATADDTATGGSNIAAAEYTIDSGAAVPITNFSPNAAKVASLAATIDAATVNALAQGPHVISVRAQDSQGNWGVAATATLTVDKTGPITSSVVAAPSPNNGTLSFIPDAGAETFPSVRVTAGVSDAASGGATVVAAEAGIDSLGAAGSGIVMHPADGLWNSASESVYVDIPLTTIVQLTEGTHNILVRGKDAAGNWGTTSTGTLVIDKTAPTITNASLSPNTVAFGAASVTLNVAATDAGVVIGGQYWIDGSATPPAAPTAFTGSSATIATSALAAGTHTVYVRMQDNAGNWSAVSSVALYVVQAVADSYSTTIQNNATGNNRTQTINISAANGVLANDQPVGIAGRTATPPAPVVTRIAGTGSATMTVSLSANGAFSYTLTVPNSVNGNGNIRAAKRGTYQFTYTETLNGVTSTATVTITVN